MINLRIITPAGKLTMRFDPKKTLKDVKEFTLREFGLTASFEAKGKPILLDEEKTLEDLGLKDNDLIFLEPV